MASFDFTQVLKAAQAGDQMARNRLFEEINENLRKRANFIVDRRDPFSKGTSLVNEAYLRLFKEEGVNDLKNREYFFSAMTNQMHKILSERIRTRARRPASSSLEQLGDSLLAYIEDNCPFTYEQMRDEIKKLKRSRNERKARRHQLVEYHYITGMTIKDAAALLGISYAQAREDKRLAEAELYLAIKKATAE